MSEQPITESDAERLQVVIERMTELTYRVRDVNVELNKIRQDARINGYDLDALNQVVNFRTKSSKDRGVGTITKLVEYSAAAGDPIASVTVAAQMDPSALSNSVEPDPTLVTSSSGYEIEDEREQKANPLRQFLYSIGITVFLLWLIH